MHPGGRHHRPEHRWYLRRGIQGDVYIQAVVTVDGTVTEPKLLRGLGSEELDARAIRSILEWRFQPGRKHGEPVPVIALFTVTYRIHDDSSNSSTASSNGRSTLQPWADEHLPVFLSIDHDHFIGSGSSVLALGDSTISFEETDNPDHRLVVGVEEVTELVDAENGSADMTIHFRRDTVMGARITFSISLANRVRLIRYVRAYCPDATLSIH